VIVLGVDTATPRLSVALVGPDGVLASFEAPEGRRHTELLVPAIAEICAAAGLSLGRVDAIGVDVGPGLFTGLRVGLATAAALSSALVCPAVGVTSTDALAEPHHQPGRQVVAVVDARRSEVAWARYAAGGGEPVEGPALASPDDLAPVLAAMAAEIDNVLVVGDGALRYRDQLVLTEPVGGAAGPSARLELDVASPFPSASVVATMVRRRLLAGGSSAAGIAPLYLRAADVNIGWASHDLPAGVTSHSGARA
jgi:tRNA threonylcarbamoyladenosine biosynthesis protein TsaB